MNGTIPTGSPFSARTLKERILVAHNNAMTALAVAERPAGPIKTWEEQMDEALNALVDEIDRLEARLDKWRDVFAGESAHRCKCFGEDDGPDGSWAACPPDLCEADALLARAQKAEAERDAARTLCNICMTSWPNHHESCAYPANVRDKEAAEAERDEYRFWNERVRTCENHTNDVIDGECLVCEVARLTSESESAQRALDYGTSAAEERDAALAEVARLREALRGKCDCGHIHDRDNGCDDCSCWGWSCAALGKDA